MLGLCFVLYEALDLFQGCYQHYHHSTNTNGLADIEKHNKSVLTRTNKIIKDIIVEEDELCLIEDDIESESVLSTTADVGSSEEAQVVATLSIDVEAAKLCADYEEENDEAEDRRHYQANRNEEDFMRMGTIVPGDTTILGMLQDNQRDDDELLLASSYERLELLLPSGDADMEMKKRLLWKMELLNEKSSVLRQHNQQKRRMESTTSNNTQTIGDNESHFAKNYICNKQGRNFDYEKLNNSTKTTKMAGRALFIDSAEKDQNENMIRVFSVSECVQ